MTSFRRRHVNDFVSADISPYSQRRGGGLSHSRADLKGDRDEVKVPYRSHKWSRKATVSDSGNVSSRPWVALDEGPGSDTSGPRLNRMTRPRMA